MFFRSAGLLASTMFGVVGFIAKHANEKYPAEGNMYNYGDKLSMNGRSVYVVGYTGHDEKSAKQLMEKGTNRELYFGTKEIAQRYAEINGKRNGHTLMIVADQLPKQNDFEAQAFEGVHTPLSPKGLKRINAKFIHLEPVTLTNRHGTIAALNRMAITWKGFLQNR